MSLDSDLTDGLIVHKLISQLTDNFSLLSLFFSWFISWGNNLLKGY